jgi:hypothetical protein
MDERKDTQRQQGVKRNPVIMERDCTLGVISFQDLTWADHIVKVVDQSIIGIGVECDLPIEPGIIWFKECVYGQKCGVLMWCKQSGVRYRAGIQFISFTREQEMYLRQQVEQLQPRKPLKDPEGVLASLIDSVKKVAEGSFESL